MRTSLIFISTIVFLFFTCCGQSEAPVKVNSLEFEIVKFSDTEGDCGDQGSGCVELAVEYPKIKNLLSPGAKRVDEYIWKIILSPVIDESEPANIEAFRDSLFSMFREFKAEFSDSPQSWMLNRKVNPAFNSKGIFSMEYFEESYLGGAHGMEMKYYYNIDLNSGKDITLNELIINEKITELNTIAEEIFRKQNSIPAKRKLSDAGYTFENNKFLLNENFLITENGLLFRFNPYDIGPYSIGSTELIIPYSSIRHLIISDTFPGAVL